MPKVLFICSGNVGRSQMAEAFYNDMTNSNDASSAGTNPNTPIKYLVLPDEIIQLMDEEGIDVSTQKVKQATDEMIKKADLIVVMCEKNLCPALVTDSKKTIYWDVEDPYKKSFERMREIRGLVRKKVREFLNL